MKIDVKQELRPCYHASAKEVMELDVPPLRYLMVDGQGDPNHSADYAQAVEALFATAYTAKFMVKKGELAIDYGVMPLEGLWWAEDMSVFDAQQKGLWQWTMMILQPHFVSEAIVEAAVAEMQRKKGLPALSKLRFEELVEGRCAQILHLGPFAAEGPTVARLHDFVDERGGRRGKHHEIYLSDIRRAAPAKWKTIIRQPMN